MGRDLEKKRAVSRAYWARHRDRLKQKSKEEYRNNPKIKYNLRKSYIKVHYNLTIEQWEELMISQGYKCPICNRNLRDLPTKFVHTDHDHKTGKVRAILCIWCNSILGNSQEDIHILQSTINYINHHAKGSDYN